MRFSPVVACLFSTTLASKHDDDISGKSYPKTPAPEGDCLVDAWAFYYWSSDRECNDTWRNWDDWCTWSANCDVDEKEC